MKKSEQTQHPNSPFLTGWKRIGEWLGVHPETARRWKKKCGLPVMIADGIAITTHQWLQIWVGNNLAREAMALSSDQVNITLELAKVFVPEYREIRCDLETGQCGFVLALSRKMDEIEKFK